MFKCWEGSIASCHSTLKLQHQAGERQPTWSRRRKQDPQRGSVLKRVGVEELIHITGAGSELRHRSLLLPPRRGGSLLSVDVWGLDDDCLRKRCSFNGQRMSVVFWCKQSAEGVSTHPGRLGAERGVRAGRWGGQKKNKKHFKQKWKNLPVGISGLSF